MDMRQHLTERALDMVEHTVQRRENGQSRAENLLKFAAQYGLSLLDITLEQHNDYRWEPPASSLAAEIGSYSGKGGKTVARWWAVAPKSAAQVIVQDCTPMMADFPHLPDIDSLSRGYMVQREVLESPAGQAASKILGARSFIWDAPTHSRRTHADVLLEQAIPDGYTMLPTTEATRKVRINRDGTRIAFFQIRT